MRKAPPKPLSLEAYREWERRQPTRHELIAGEIVPITGARAGHVRMVRRLMDRLTRHLRGSDCETFSNDLRLIVPQGDAFYPDIVVVCGEARPRDDEDEISAATVVVEVISPSTAQIDDTRKRWGYMSLPMLAHYVLVDPLRMECEVVSREPDGSCRGQRFAAPDDLLTLPALSFSVRLADLYRDDRA